ncbi:MAG TPA: type II CAAX endopeptidase family protein [Gemmatimonadales bacterium]|nr:type II CAAX endopeptidase family protein [Gemmatimonadales bacterium]
MPLPADYAFTFMLLVVASIYEYVVFWPQFRAAIAAGRPDARRQGYRRGITGQWLFATSALVIWAVYDRPAALLRLTLPGGWRLVVAIGVVLLAIGLLCLQLLSVARLSPERRVKARPKLGNVAFMLPQTAGEERWFVALSLTAGFCEELLYRGYLPWFFAPWLGQVGAMAAVVLAFGLSHLYQGRKGAIRATLAGAVMAAIALITGSLIPGMIAHALIDIGGGTVGYWLLREQPTLSSSFSNSAPAMSS